jgi:hypothetical protein
MDIGAWTVRVLEDGLPPLPARLERGQTVPIARWRGERYGAVLFVRVWKDGTLDSDCAVTRRAADGSWEEPGAWGGGGWIDDPLVRPRTGWDGDPVVWLGMSGIGSEEEVIPSDAPGFSITDVVAPRDDAAPWTGLDARALLGAAAKQVAAIEVEHEGRTWTVAIESPCGAFIVGLEAPGPATLRVLGHDGRLLPDAEGATELVL